MDRAGGKQSNIAANRPNAAAPSLCFDGAHATMFDYQPSCAHVAVGGRTGLPRLRHVGDSDMLLCGRRAAKVAHPRPDTAANVAVDIVTREAESVRASLHDFRVLSGNRGRRLYDIQLALHAPKVGI